MSMTERDFEIAEGWLREAMEYGEERHNEPYEKAIHALEEIQQYKAIGTVSEFKQLKEKATAKKPLAPFTHKGCGNHCCPNCTHPLTTFCEDYNMEYCEWCGQKLDWSEGKE